MKNQITIDRHRDSIALQINDTNRREIILSLLVPKYQVSWKKKGRRTQLDINFKNY